MRKNCLSVIYLFIFFAILSFSSGGISLFGSSRSGSLSVLSQSEVSAVDAVENPDEISDSSIKDDDVFISVPSYWDGYDDESNGLGHYDLFGLGEYPSIHKLESGNYFSTRRIQNIDFSDNYEVTPVSSSVICTGDECDNFECKRVADKDFIICVDTGEFVDTKKFVSTPCVWVIDDELKLVSCIYPDYLYDYWYMSKLTSSKCINGSSSSYCDWKFFSDFAYSFN
jgi:hypothetical protein